MYVMKASVYHLQLNVRDATISLPFYKDLFVYFAYSIIDESDEHIGASNGTTDFWIIQTEQKYLSNHYHRKGTGFNHIAFRVSSKQDVDLFAQEFLQKKKIKILYQTPRLFPEYHQDYYAVFFEDPDRIKLEVVFVPRFEKR